MLNEVHSILSPPAVRGHNGFDLTLDGKLEKGDGTFTFKKEILGWEIGGNEYTIKLIDENVTQSLSC
jgi:hypothetical protein